MNTIHQSPETPESTATAELPRHNERLDAGAAALFASAFILLAILLVQLSSAFTPGAAYAQSGGIDRNNDVVTLAAQSASDASVLLVLDQRDERLYVYELENGRRLRLVDGENLPELFASGSRGGRSGR